MASSGAGSVREELLWGAIKARKANLIDQRVLEVIKKLVKEPSSPETDRKVQDFSRQFHERLQGKLSPRATSVSLTRHEQPEAIGSFINLHDAVVRRIATYLHQTDVASLATTSFGMCTMVYPPHQWKNIIRAKLLPPADVEAVEDVPMDEEEGNAPVQAPPVVDRSVLNTEELQRLCNVLDSTEGLFKIPDPDLFRADPRHARHLSLGFFGRGLSILLEPEPRRAVSAALCRYLVPRLAQLQVRLSVSISVPERGRLASGDALLLERAFVHPDQFNVVHLVFRVPLTSIAPPIVSPNASDIVMHALERDGRTISPVQRWTLVSDPVSTKALVALDSTHRRTGRVPITIGGERSAKYLGRLLHDDEHFYETEVRTNAGGGHGQGSFDVRGMREVVTLQTPRMIFKPPAGYFEISQRVGVEVTLPLVTLFRHCS